MDLQYVRKLQWDKSSCKSAIIGGGENPCCQTLLSLFGVGLAQYLRDASMFELPNNASAVSCLGLFQQQLDSLGLSADLVSICFHKSVFEFVSSPLLCAGIQTKQDWMDKLGITPLDSACKGDLSDLAACQACKDSGDLVQRELVKTYRNLTNVATSKICYYFTVLYAAGVANEFGPKTKSTAECTLRVPFVETASRGRVLTYGFMGAAAALLICVFGLLYRLWKRKRNRKAEHRGFVRRNEKLLNSSVNPTRVQFGSAFKRSRRPPMISAKPISSAKGASLRCTVELFRTVGGSR
jgi:hypothetical protein